MAQGLHGHIISDGGCTVPGDVCMALGAGADFVMLGGMLVGYGQCPGNLQLDASGNQFKLFYGMCSRLAQEKYDSGLASHMASEGEVVEGSLPRRCLNDVPARSPCDRNSIAAWSETQRN